MAGTGAGMIVKLFTPPSGLATSTSLPPPSSSASSSFNLRDKEKRWLVVGVCLNKFLLPVLRNFLDLNMQDHYGHLQITNGIDHQTYAKHMASDGVYNLNYGSINNNDMNHKRKVALYDYCVRSAVDLAKLYLKPNMAKLSGFGSNCDLSAVLGILAGANVFSAATQTSAASVRQDVRNEWGHCNFDKWDMLRYSVCFQKMETLLRTLTLGRRREERLLNELSDWEIKGLQLCMGNLVDADLMKLVSKEVANLTEEVERLKQNEVDEGLRVTEELQKVRDAIHDFEEQEAKMKDKVASLENSRDKHEQQLEHLSGACAVLSTDVDSLKSRQDKVETNVETITKDQQYLREEVGNERLQREKVGKRVGRVEEKQANLEGRVGALESAVDSKNISRSLNTFQAPYRIPCFCGRIEELQTLAKSVKVTVALCSISAVCGLGGTGKTSLAIEHVWAHKDDYSGGVFWISGESTHLFQISVTEMARQLEIYADDFTQTVSNTLDWLQTREQYWCLVIDNLDVLELSDDMLKMLRGHWKQQASGHIIITTRREKKLVREEIMGIDDEQCVELKNLSEVDSMEFMKLRTEKTQSDEDSVIAELVSEIGCLPLALDQAAAYIRYLGCTFSEYKEEYSKRKLNLLTRLPAHYPVQNTSRDRISVQTTWEINFDYVCCLSKEAGIGKAAALVMEASAFLSPDDIPHEVINEGLSQVENEDLRNCTFNSFEVSEVLSLLTNFSLFQRFTDQSYSVHRLVQEVIRGRIEKNHMKDVLQSATRMLNFAFCRTRSPVEVCQSFTGESIFIEDNPPSLHLWGKLAAHACVLQEHLLQNSQKEKTVRESLLYTEEAVKLFNEASVFLSVCREKLKAQKLQRLKLDFLVQIAEPLSKESIDQVKFFEIPLKNRDYKLISHCMADRTIKDSKEEATETDKASKETIPEGKADELREQGNRAVKEEDFEKAVDLYTEGIRFFEGDHRLFCNRALCYLKLGQPSQALEDCEKCLKLKERYSKALQRKAWALHELAEQHGEKETHLKGMSLAAAALAVYVDPKSDESELFKQMFPNMIYHEVRNSSSFTMALRSSTPNTTLLVHHGNYELELALIFQDIQIIGLGAEVVITFQMGCVVNDAKCYFENVNFANGGKSVSTSGPKGSLALRKCNVSGGLSCCEDFPECNGGPGCMAPVVGKQPCDRTGKFGFEIVSGICGVPPMQILNGSTGYMEDCNIHHGGGGGALSLGNSSCLTVKSCKVHDNCQSGLEAREGGSLIVSDSLIYGNHYHGVKIGPSASSCKVFRNRIFENFKEGIFGLKSNVEISDNHIYHNRPFGIGLFDCHASVKRNQIFENGFWGISTAAQTNAVVKNNEIYSNKCGGIFLQVNFSGRIILRSNIVRDHSGPWMMHNNQHMPNIRNKTDGDRTFPAGEMHCHSKLPVIIDNQLSNNEEGAFHPKARVESIKRECAFCRSSGKLLTCSKCNIAKYCNPRCQRMHWPRHKALCKCVTDRYSVTVTPASAKLPKPSPSRGKSIYTFGNIFSSELKGIGKGPKPNPKSRKRFIVKVQTYALNCHPLQMLTVYDKSLDIFCLIQSPEIFHVIMECGVLGSLHKFTSKKVFFWTKFAEGGKKLTMYLDELAPFQKW